MYLPKLDENILEYYQRGHISTLNGNSLKLVDKFTYLRSKGMDSYW